MAGVLLGVGWGVLGVGSGLVWLVFWFCWCLAAFFVSCWGDGVGLGLAEAWVDVWMGCG